MRFKKSFKGTYFDCGTGALLIKFGRIAEAKKKPGEYQAVIYSMLSAINFAMAAISSGENFCFSEKWSKSFSLCIGTR